MRRNYTTYTAEELLNDDFFIQSELHPTEETRSFWSALVTENPKLGKEIRIARHFIQEFRQRTPSASLSSEEVTGLWRQIEAQNRKYKSNPKRRYWLVAAVAAAASLCLFLFNPFTVEEKSIDYQSLITSLPQEKSQDIQLLSDKEKLLIKGKESQITYNPTGEARIHAEEIQNQTQTASSSHVKEKKTETEIQLCKLIVPAGRRSSLELADGTKIWVNSSSTVIYPNLFTGDKREIYVEGEAYLEVAHDSERPFYVKTQTMNVRVLGTRFNVCAYQEDSQQQVVLVSGKVEVETHDQQNQILTPNELFDYDKQQAKVSVTKVDTNDYISWKEGYYQFSRQELSVLFKRLSRYYAVPIVWDETVGSLSCSGKLDLTRQIDDVLDNLKKAAPIRIEHDHEKIIIKYNPLN